LKQQYHIGTEHSATDWQSNIMGEGTFTHKMYFRVRVGRHFSVYARSMFVEYLVLHNFINAVWTWHW